MNERWVIWMINSFMDVDTLHICAHMSKNLMPLHWFYGASFPVVLSILLRDLEVTEFLATSGTILF